MHIMLHSRECFLWAMGRSILSLHYILLVRILNGIINNDVITALQLLRLWDEDFRALAGHGTVSPDLGQLAIMIVYTKKIEK